MKNIKKSIELGITALYNPPLQICSAPVAQLDRVLGYEPRGRAFESLRARQSFVKLRCRGQLGGKEGA